jgi:hypothetical protein
MSDDIVERLRGRNFEDYNEICDTAADEIKRFRAENERLRGAIMQCEIIVRQFQIENEERGKNAVSNNARLKYRAVAARSGVLFCSVKRIARAALKEHT